MKKFLFIVWLMIPFVGIAQINQSKMDRYLAPLPMQGTRIVFEESLMFKSISAEKVFEIAGNWADEYVAGFDKKFGSRVAYKNPSTKSIAVIFNRDIIFKDMAIILDKALMKCNIGIDIVDDKCIIKVLNIKYDYVEGGLTEHINADEWIIDRYALNREHTKLSKGFGKFRAKTIDAVDEIFESFKSYMAAKVAVVPVEPIDQEKKMDDGVRVVTVLEPNAAKTSAAAPAPATAAPAQQAAPAKPAVQPQSAAPKAVAAGSVTPYAVAPKQAVAGDVAPSAAAVQTASEQVGAFAGYKNIPADKIPGNFVKMLSEDWMLITAGNKDKFNMMTASWGGFGVLYNKPVVFCFINPARYTYKVIETQGDTFTITFYTEMYRDALNYCGTKSGKDEDKVKGSGLTPVQMPSGSMAFEQAWMIIECKKLLSQSLLPDSINNNEVKSQWLDKPMHKMYIGEILNVWVK